MNCTYPPIPSPSSEIHLARRRVDPSSMDDLVRSCEPRVELLAAPRRCASCDRDELEQAGRIAVWKAARRFDAAAGPFEPFATVAIINAMKDALRGNPAVLQPFEPTAPRAPVEEHFIEAVEARVDLCTARGRLTAAEESVIRLLYDEGLTQREAGRRLGVSQPFVSDLHANAIRRMRSVLAA